MSVIRTPDPAWDAERDTWQTEPLPVCCECGNEIVDDEIYSIGGDIFCEDCVRMLFHMSYTEWRLTHGL